MRMKMKVLVVLLLVSQHASGVEVFDDEESVQLPCLVKVSVSMESTVVWSRTDLRSSIVHIHQQSGEDLMEQNLRYRDRTEMRRDALETGDLTLTLRNPRVSDSETYTCTVSRFGEDLSQTDVELKVTERPPVWPKVLIGILVVLVVLVSAFGLVFCRRYKSRKENPFPWLDVEEGVESVQLPCKFRGRLPPNVTVEWTVFHFWIRKVHVFQKGSDCPAKQHQRFRGRTEMKEDLLDSGDLSLTLKHPTDGDNFNYTCTVYSTKRMILMKKQVKLQVKVCQVEVEEGVESIQLPFRTSPDLPTDTRVEWTLYEPQHMMVHVYQNSSDHPEDQNQVYRDRTKMSEDLLNSGDLTLTLKHPRVPDSGTYRCKVSSKEGNWSRETSVLVRVRERRQHQDPPEDIPLMEVH